MKSKKTLIIAFTLATSLMSGSAMAAYATSNSKVAMAASSSYMKTIVKSGNNAAAHSALFASGALDMIDSGKVYVFKRGVHKFRDANTAVPDIKSIIADLPSQKLGAVSARFSGASYKQHIGADGHYEGLVGVNTVKILNGELADYVYVEGVGNVFVDSGDFSLLPDLGQQEPANDPVFITPLEGFDGVDTYEAPKFDVEYVDVSLGQPDSDAEYDPGVGFYEDLTIEMVDRVEKSVSAAHTNRPPKPSA